MKALKTLLAWAWDEYGKFVTIDWLHHLNHLGKAFRVAKSNSLNLNDTKEYLLVTASGEEHTHFNLAGVMSAYGAGATVEIFEAPTQTDPGTGITIPNRNRNKTTITPGLTLTEDPTITVDGDSVFFDQVGSGQKVGGDSKDRQELELAAGTEYLIRLTSLGNSNTVVFVCDFYEAQHVN